MTPPRIGELIDRAARRLVALPAPSLDAEFLFRGVSGATRAELLARAHEPAPPEVVLRFEAAVARRLEHEPLQYILGVAAFWRDEFVVNPAVLIPRPETEILVEAAATRLKPIQEPTFLDLGTGSGCIALSLLRELPRARALAVDISDRALAVASLNARRLGLDDRIDFAISRWFDGIGPPARFDAIVSNPPYVAHDHRPDLPPEVREFEPGLALYAEPADDLSSYRAIAAEARARLREGGLLALEVGQGQAGRVAALLAEAGFSELQSLMDLAGIPRVVLGRA